MNRYTIDRKENGYVLTVKTAPNGNYICCLVFMSLQEVFDEIISIEPNPLESAS